MAVLTLEEAKQNATTDLDLTVIDEFRKESTILDSLVFDDAVNPAGGGGTLTYGYRRQVTQATAATRAINTEYVDQNVTTERHVVDLAVMGGSFAVDRVSAKVGAAASGAVALNMAQKIKAARTKFQDEVINGDTAVDPNGFDGLDKALAGSSTEFGASSFADWSDFDTDERSSFKALDLLDEFLSLLDGAPTILVGNAAVLGRVRAMVRRTNQYVASPVEGLIGPGGRPITRETYGGVLFADAGEKAGSSAPIIPVESRTIGGTARTGLSDLYAYRVGIDGFHGVSTMGGAIAQAWLPNFATPGAVKRGEVELGPVAVALKATKAAAVLRNIKVR